MSLVVSAGCTLLSLTTTPTPTDLGWQIAMDLRLGAEPIANVEGCEVSMVLDGSTTLEHGSGRVNPPNERKYKLDSWRFHESKPDSAGYRTLTIPLPELQQGDVAHIDIELGLVGIHPWEWQPGLSETAFGELKLTTPASTIFGGTDGPEMHNDGAWVWVETPGPEASAVLPHPADPLAPAPTLSAPPPSCADVRTVDQHSHLALFIPGNDPQRALWPGAGSWVRHTQDLTLGAGPQCTWVVHTRHAYDTEVTGAEQRSVGGGTIVVVPADQTHVVIAYSEPDAPVFGEAVEHPDGTRSVDVSAADGEIGWESLDGDRVAWHLISWREKPILADREQLIAGLQYRFATQSFPEPGTPMKLRGHSSGWELAGLLRDALHSRVSIADIPVEPLWPRHLMTARRARVLSPIEAALVLSMYLNQNKFQAQWVLVRPRAQGTGPSMSPSGYTDALVRVTWAGEVRWMDPGCPLCGHFELRPELLDSSALGWEVHETPPLDPGREDRTTDEDTLTVKLEGPPALRLRQALAAVPPDAQRPALVNHYAPGGTLVSVDGLSNLGGVVLAVFTLPHPPATPEPEIDDATTTPNGEHDFDASQRSFP